MMNRGGENSKHGDKDLSKLVQFARVTEHQDEFKV